MEDKTWHDKHMKDLSFGDKIADKVAVLMGSWKFIILQTIFLTFWIVLNAIGIVYQWDLYPFVFLNLVLAIMTVYSGPIIMMSQNRQSDRDRLQASEDLRIDIECKKDIESLLFALSRIETEKLDSIMITLNYLLEHRKD